MIRRAATRRASREGRRLTLESLEPRMPLDASMLRITEFVASNDNGITDFDGDASDWIEIYNSGVDAVDLGGLHLTDKDDDLDRWTFPAGDDAAGGRLPHRLRVEQRHGDAESASCTRTSRLGAGGEYLALVAADGVTVIDEYAPEFPEQVEDVSYGRAMAPTGAGTTLVASFAQGKAWIPTNSSHDATWTGLGYNDAGFNISGQTGFGYEAAPGDPVNFTAELAHVGPDRTRSLYMRIPFTLTTLTGHRPADAADEVRRRLRGVRQRRRSRRGQRPRHAAVELGVGRARERLRGEGISRFRRQRDHSPVASRAERPGDSRRSILRNGRRHAHPAGAGGDRVDDRCARLAMGSSRRPRLGTATGRISWASPASRRSACRMGFTTRRSRCRWPRRRPARSSFTRPMARRRPSTRASSPPTARFTPGRSTSPPRR